MKIVQLLLRGKHPFVDGCKLIFLSTTPDLNLRPQIPEGAGLPGMPRMGGGQVDYCPLCISA